MLERILSLIEDSGLTDSAFCYKLTIGNGTIGKWRNGKQKPSLDAVVKISNYFNVSMDYLIYGKESFPNVNTSLSESDIEWLNLIHELPHNKQLEFKGELIGYLKALHDLKK